jgi:hypothetical protein
VVYYTCIGARDRILDHCLPRSSVATTPVLRVSTSTAICVAKIGLTVHSGSDGVSGLVHEHTRIVIELHKASVGSLHFLLDSDNNGMSDISSTDLVGDTTVS